MLCDGVPGAGKALVGFNVAVKQTYQCKDTPVEDECAVYLSGNDPFVVVLTEALPKKAVTEKKIKGR